MAEKYANEGCNTPIIPAPTDELKVTSMNDDKVVHILSEYTNNSLNVPDGPPVSAIKKRQFLAADSESLTNAKETTVAIITFNDNPFPVKPVSTYVLPETIYTAALLMPLSIERDKVDKNAPGRVKCVSYGTIGGQYIGLFLSHAAQLLLVYYIRGVVQDAGACGVGGMPLCVCLTLFCGSLLSDVKETWAMLMWLYNIKTEKEHTRLRVVGVEGEADKYKIDSGMTKTHKLSAVILILMPKMAIFMWLLGYGAEYLMGSETVEDLILNALALGFVCEVDEFAYGIMSPVYLRQVIENLPPLEVASINHESQSASRCVCCKDQELQLKFMNNIINPIFGFIMLICITTGAYITADCLEYEA